MKTTDYEVEEGMYAHRLVQFRPQSELMMPHDDRIRAQGHSTFGRFTVVPDVAGLSQQACLFYWWDSVEPPEVEVVGDDVNELTSEACSSSIFSLHAVHVAKSRVHVSICRNLVEKSRLFTPPQFGTTSSDQGRSWTNR